MADNLTVFGTDYTGVMGIKAKGTNNGTLTYIRPFGTKTINVNGTNIDVSEYASVDVNVTVGVEVDGDNLSYGVITQSIVNTARVGATKL